jgi:putative flippase GtrA
MRPARRSRYHGPAMEGTAITTSRLSSLRRRMPRPAVASKFAATGLVVGAVHLGLVSVLVLAGMPIQIALAISFVVALALHFTLNRQWVFSADSGYALHFSRQGLRYLLAAGLSYAGTSIAVAVLPDVLGIPELAVFFLAAGAMACVSFTILHLWVFHAAPGEGA